MMNDLADDAVVDAPDELDMELMEDFFREARQHLSTTYHHLLQFETEAAGDEEINVVFRAFHSIKGVSGFLHLNEIHLLAHESETLLDLVRSGRLRVTSTIVSVLLEAVDMLRKLVSVTQQAVSKGKRAGGPSADLPYLLERLRQLAEADPNDSDEDTIGDRDAQPGRREDAKGQSDASKGNPGNKRTLRVDADQFDRLIDMIGELAVAESLVIRSPELQAVHTPSLIQRLTWLDRVARDLQQMGTALWVTPVQALFERMARVIQDVADRLGKMVELVVIGEETEIDRLVVDQLVDPLVHMVRNAVDHGIEKSADIRRQKGKRETATLALRAFRRGNTVTLEVEDDGAGLNKEAILRKAEEKGIIAAGEYLSDSQVYDLIFRPGFSTAQKVTELSGRGVGLDVVRRNLEAVGGSITVRSQQDRGTCFSISVPLTLAVIEGMVFAIGNERYIIPIFAIERLLQLDGQNLTKVVNRGEVVTVNDHHVPVFYLGDVLGVPRNDKMDMSKATMVLVHDEEKRAAFVVDQVLGQQQFVIKNLGEMSQRVPEIAGGAILPDGSIGLVIDVRGVLQRQQREAGG